MKFPNLENVSEGSEAHNRHSLVVEIVHFLVAEIFERSSDFVAPLGARLIGLETFLVSAVAPTNRGGLDVT